MQERKNNFELLRIIAMLMVMSLHALGHGGVLNQYSVGTVGYTVFWLIEAFCYVAVNSFVLMTGYFMINSDFKISRIIKLMIQVEFYSILCTAIAYFIFHQTITLKDLIYAIFPLTSREYWFASCYAVLLIFAPFINWTVRHMSQKNLFFINIVLIILFCLIPTVFFWSRMWLCDGYDIIWFVTLYFVASYIRLYGERYLQKKNFFLLYLILVLGGYASRVLIAAVTDKLLGVEKGANILFSYNSVIFFPAAVCLFMTFCQMGVKLNKVLNVIAKAGSLSFGAYLWTEHKLIRAPLWKIINVSGKYQNNVGRTLVYVICVVFALFLIGIFIEWIRLKLMRLLRLKRFLEKCDDRADILKEKLEHRIDRNREWLS